MYQIKLYIIYIYQFLLNILKGITTYICYIWGKPKKQHLR
jgi:hypothetical protein